MLQRSSVVLSFTGVRTRALADVLRVGATERGSEPAIDDLDLSLGAVVFSQSTDIFTNLAIEEALSTGCRFAPPASASAAPLAASGAKIADPVGIAGPILFLYRNTPCVVIGCNQIPWREANVPALERPPDGDDGQTAAPTLARRNSGGGAVYHDLGNLCLSFITHRKAHDPKANMDWLAAALRRLSGERDLATSSTDRHDLFIDGMKVSGSAMKLMRTTAYHHCTLLVDSDLGTVGRSLRAVCPKESFSDTPCVDSVRSRVTSVAGSCGSAIDHASDDYGARAPTASEALALALAHDWRASELKVGDVPFVAIAQADGATTSYEDLTARKPKQVRIPEVIEKSRQWEWRYGHTSRFTCDSGSLDLTTLDCTVRLVTQVKKGVVSKCDVTVTSSGGLTPAETQALQTAVAEAIVGRQLREESLRDPDPFVKALAGCRAQTGAVVADAAEAPTLWNDLLVAWADACGWWPTGDL